MRFWRNWDASVGLCNSQQGGARYADLGVACLARLTGEVPEEMAQATTERFPTAVRFSCSDLTDCGSYGLS